MPQKQQRPIRGLLIIGGDGTGKTTLLQQSVLRLISGDAELGVVYVGEEDSCLSLRALIDPCYLLSDDAPPEDAARRGAVKTVVIPRAPPRAQMLGTSSGAPSTTPASRPASSGSPSRSTMSGASSLPTRPKS